MSYARFGADGSDVYVFATTRALECCMCALVPRRWVDDPGSMFGGYFEQLNREDSEEYSNNAEMIAHLEQHQAAGHFVPESAFARLRDPADAAENEAFWKKYRETGEV